MTRQAGMDAPSWTDLTRRQQLWLLDQQVEAVRRARAGMKPGILSRALRLHPNALKPLEVAHAPLPARTVETLASLTGWTAQKFQPYHRVPAHDDLPEIDLTPLRAWEGPPLNRSSSKPVRIPAIGQLVDQRLRDIGANRLDLARAAAHRPTALSHTLSTGRSSEAAVRRLAFVLGMTMEDFGLEGGPPPAPPVHRPDIRPPERRQDLNIPMRAHATPAPDQKPVHPTPKGFLLERCSPSAFRIAMHARMTRARAEAIRTALRQAVSITDSTGPKPDAVEIQFDTVVREAVAADVRRILSSPLSATAS